jgi:hypothetical protein
MLSILYDFIELEKLKFPSWEILINEFFKVENTSIVCCKELD